jgi:glyoxylase-like metal-dependent hydrolase (beta-lactamase superfamily II)
MINNSYSFRLGNFECRVINDGKCSAPVEDQEHGNGERRLSFIDLDIITLLIKTQNRTVLLDTGWGVVDQTEPRAGLTIKNLKSAGIQPEEIDAVIITHGHVDHIGGAIDDSGSPAFPNARYYMYRKEWEFWTSGSDFSCIPEDVRESAILTVKKILFPLKDRIVPLDAETDILPGISFIKTPGHSPGLIVLVVTSNNQRLFCLSDLFHQTREIENPGQYLIPPATGEAYASRTRILSLIKEEDLVCGGHFPFPGLGHIVCREGTRRWEPIK